MAYSSKQMHNRRHRTADRDGWFCWVCGVDLRCAVCEPEDDPVRPGATLDHVVRLADGGLNHISNWAVACGPCNNERHDAEVHRAKRERAKVTPRVERRPKPNDQGPTYPIVWDAQLKTFIVDRKGRRAAYTPVGPPVVFDP